MSSCDSAAAFNDSAVSFSGGAPIWTRQHESLVAGAVAGVDGLVGTSRLSGITGSRLPPPERSPSGCTGAGTGTSDAPSSPCATVGAATLVVSAPLGPPVGRALAVRSGGGTRSSGLSGSGIVDSTACASADGRLSVTAGAAPLEVMIPPEAVVPTFVPADGIGDGFGSALVPGIGDVAVRGGRCAERGAPLGMGEAAPGWVVAHPVA